MEASDADPLPESESFFASAVKKQYVVLGSCMTFIPIFALIGAIDATEFVVVGDLKGDDIGQVAYAVLFPFFFISSILAIRLYGMKFAAPLLIVAGGSIPIGVWEYQNKAENTCHRFGFPGETSTPCPAKPELYDLPRTVMLVYLIVWTAIALAQHHRSKNEGRLYGMLYGIGFGYFVYLWCYVNGGW